jgi:hypothetical protein
LDGRVDTLSGCGLGPWRPSDLFALDLEWNDDDMGGVFAGGCNLLRRTAVSPLMLM